MRLPPDTLRARSASRGALAEPPMLVAVDLSLINRRQKPLQEAVGGPVVDPAHHGNHIVLRININHIDSVTNMCESTRRCARPQSLVGVEKPVHEPVGGFWLRRGECPLDPLPGEQLAVF